MAQDSDDGQKTEQPSQRKLQRARSEGRVAQSREINTWFILAMTGLLIEFMGPGIAHTLSHVLGAFARPDRFLDGDGIVWRAVGANLREAALSLAAPLFLLMLAAVAATLVQTGFVFATEKIGFQLSHISPATGFERLLSFRSLVEMLKSLAKMGIVAAVLAIMLHGELHRLPMMSNLGPAAVMDEIERLVLRLLLSVLMVLSVMAGADYFFQRLQHMQSMRMTKHEVKDEMKQAEGDPLIKARLRQIRADRARRRMMAAVPSASVVITNPTHFAVALKYDMGAAGAPRVVAKGADLIAQRIRELAVENDVPVVENPPLARALYSSVDLDREIPPEHYKVVAEIISYVFRLKGKLRPQRAPS
jgi:flagellar biosynthesis protein FlhB